MWNGTTGRELQLPRPRINIKGRVRGALRRSKRKDS